MLGDTVYDARAVANYLLNKALNFGGLDALQVMKLTYIAHGFTLGLHGKPLLEDDIEAWEYGPVVRRVYAALPGGAGRINVLNATVEPAAFGQREQGVVDGVYTLYGSLSGLLLSKLTHRPGSPWERTWNTYGRNAVIPREVIQSHYKRIVEEWRVASAAGKPYSADVL